MSEEIRAKPDWVELAALCLGVASLGISVFVWMSYHSHAINVAAAACGVFSVAAHLAARTRSGWGKVGALFGIFGIVLSTLSYLFVHVFPRQV